MPDHLEDKTGTGLSQDPSPSPIAKPSQAPSDPRKRSRPSDPRRSNNTTATTGPSVEQLTSAAAAFASMRASSEGLPAPSVAPDSAPSDSSAQASRTKPARPAAADDDAGAMPSGLLAVTSVHETVPVAGQQEEHRVHGAAGDGRTSASTAGNAAATFA